MTRHVGRPLPRVEDSRFVTGQGRYTGDIRDPGRAGRYHERARRRVGILSAKHYSDVLDTPENRRFISAFIQKHKIRPDAWAEQMYVGLKAVAEALRATGGAIEDRPRFLEALRRVRFEGPVGPVWFDENQQRVFDVYMRKVEKSGGEYVNRVVDRFPNVSQSWTPQ